MRSLLQPLNVIMSGGSDMAESTSLSCALTSLRRYEAARWLRKTVGVVGGKDLPAEPSEEDFRLGLRSGTILCNVLNKFQPGAVPKKKKKDRERDLAPFFVVQLQAMEQLRSAMEEHMDQMTDLNQKLSAELRSGLKPALDNFLGFFPLYQLEGTLVDGFNRQPFCVADSSYYFQEES